MKASPFSKLHCKWKLVQSKGEKRSVKQMNVFSSMSASDISDTDFACQSEGEKESHHSTSEEAEEEDLEKLERARAELQVEQHLFVHFKNSKGSLS
jgi:hypothetical protein